MVSSKCCFNTCSTAAHGFIYYPILLSSVDVEKHVLNSESRRWMFGHFHGKMTINHTMNGGPVLNGSHHKNGQKLVKFGFYLDVLRL